MDAYGLAVLRAALRQRRESFAELERAVEENSAGLFTLDVDPKTDYFRSDPRYPQLRERLLGDRVPAGALTIKALPPNSENSPGSPGYGRLGVFGGLGG